MMDEYKDRDQSAEQETDEMSVTEAFRNGQQSLAEQPVVKTQQAPAANVTAVFAKPSPQATIKQAVKPSLAQQTAQSLTFMDQLEAEFHEAQDQQIKQIEHDLIAKQAMRDENRKHLAKSSGIFAAATQLV